MKYPIRKHGKLEYKIVKSGKKYRGFRPMVRDSEGEFTKDISRWYSGEDTLHAAKVVAEKHARKDKLA